jgi:phage internal scaffolding protein
MSKDYREKNPDAEVPVITSPEMRKHSQRPGKKDEHGNPLYFTEQAHKRETDVNEIVKKYDKTGLITHIANFEAKFGDMTGMEFQKAQEMVANAKSQFEMLPSEIRNRFANDPMNLLKFMEKKENRDEAIKLGLIHPDTPENKDGLGEHVKEQWKKPPKDPADPNPPDKRDQK